jgi:hypothetical protein
LAMITLIRRAWAARLSNARVFQRLVEFRSQRAAGASTSANC